MKIVDIVLLVLLGIVFWILGTLWYRARGQVFFETTGLRYWLNFVVTPVLSTAVCMAIFRWRGIPVLQWSSAALLVAIPGMAGEAVLLSNFSGWMPGMRETTAGPYGGFLFATYALVLSVAGIIALNAAS